VTVATMPTGVTVDVEYRWYEWQAVRTWRFGKWALTLERCDRRQQPEKQTTIEALP